jgi:hypothetical protein
MEVAKQHASAISNDHRNGQQRHLDLRYRRSFETTAKDSKEAPVVFMDFDSLCRTWKIKITSLTSPCPLEHGKG